MNYFSLIYQMFYCDFTFILRIPNIRWLLQESNVWYVYLLNLAKYRTCFQRVAYIQFLF